MVALHLLGEKLNADPMDSSGLTVVTTASPEHFALVKSRGADVVFDYHDPEFAQKVQAYTNNAIPYVMDCVSTEASVKLLAETLPKDSSVPIRLVSNLPIDSWPRKDVETSTILAYTTLGEAFHKFGIDFPALPEHYKFGVMFWKLSNELLSAGKLKPHPVALREGGLHGIPNG